LVGCASQDDITLKQHAELIRHHVSEQEALKQRLRHRPHHGAALLNSEVAIELDEFE
jgi:hypothetical protein